jgi:hypothetical protein
MPACAGMTEKRDLWLFTVKMRFALPRVGQATSPARSAQWPTLHFHARGRQDAVVMSIYEIISLDVFLFSQTP